MKRIGFAAMASLVVDRSAMELWVHIGDTTPLIPRLQALSQEGEAGRERLQMYSHWMTVPLALFQGYAQLVLIQNLGGISNIGFTGPNLLPTVATLFSLVAGTMFLVWLGELISERGIGNGVSILILGGIVARVPSIFSTGIVSGAQAIGGILLLAVIAIAVVALIVLFQEAQRRIPVQYARSQFRGGRLYRQQGQSHIPLRVNSAGMIPLIFATSIMIFPPLMAQFLAKTVDVGWIQRAASFFESMLSPTGLVYWLGTFLLVGLSVAAVERLMAALSDDAVGGLLALPVPDTVKRADGDGRVSATVPRQGLWLAQTPQAFRCDWLQAVHRKAHAESVHATDDAFLFEWVGHPVVVVEGSGENIKVTRPEDMVIGEAILGSRTAARSGGS